MHTLTNQLAKGRSVLDVASSPEEVARKISAVSPGRHRPILVFTIDGAQVPTRLESARGSRLGRKRHRAKRAYWHGQWREAKRLHGYLLDNERMMHLFSWHQVAGRPGVSRDAEAGQRVKEAGLMRADQAHLCVMADGMRWMWKHVEELFPTAEPILDYSHCAEHVHALATLQ